MGDLRTGPRGCAAFAPVACHCFDLALQGRPQLRRTSVRRHTQKIRPSMLPLAALTVAGSASASSLNEVRAAPCTVDTL
jgi:hypothetical protein